MSVLLPKTDFPMKGNLNVAEPERLEFWQKNKIYEKMIARNKGEKKFVMPDGPPYANGSIHVGHVLNKVLKDIVIKYQNMAGKEAAFIPGWDCHGLPIELNVTKKLGIAKKNAETKGEEAKVLTDPEFRDLCRKEAMIWVDLQRTQFKRLGILADWENPYLTLNSAYEADEVRVLADIHDNGVFYRGKKPVYWCPALQTAYAAAEVEYKNVKSPSIFVKFDWPSGSEKWLPNNKDTVSFVIWTTTPWTLPANVAISLNPNFTYGFYQAKDGVYIIAEQLLESFQKTTGTELKLLKTALGKELELQKAKHPFIDRDSVIVLGEHVTAEAGTGCVHTAPGHGLDDYIVGLQYNLPILSPVDGAGRYSDEFPEMKGMKIWDANPLIIEKLKNSNHLVFVGEIEHSYPHNPRSKVPSIFRATPQWFIRIDDENFSVRKKALELVEGKIQFYPNWGKARLNSMIEHSPDWCVSRQRLWGVPVPVYYCEKCEEPLINSKVMRKLADKMEQSKQGIEAYHSTAPSEITDGHACEKCGNKNFKTGKDILDVWFDSGVCHTAVQKRHPSMTFPADLYLEGSDQHRGWFQTSLISSVAAYKETPFKSLVTHGFVMDAQGYKMSKSQGNVVDPEQIIKESGAEILRLWVAFEDYGQDLTIGKNMIGQLAETYRKFRNTIRFILGNLSDFDPAKDAVATEKLLPVDRWALSELQNLIVKCTAAYESYEFHKVYHALNQYFAVEMSALYLDFLKDRLYTRKADSHMRRSAQTVLYQIVKTFTGLMAPISPFLAEETYQYTPGKDQESIFITQFPKAEEALFHKELETDFRRLVEIRRDVTKILEVMRKNKQIGASLEAEVHITAEGKDYDLLKKYEATLKEIFIVSYVFIEKGAFKVEAKQSRGQKCTRCWNYDENLISNSNFPEHCPKCIEALT